jgi:NADH dehydrogenase (ubiquinone) Fe-S protein 8
MASLRPLASMARMRHASKLVSVYPQVWIAVHRAHFSTTGQLLATPRGPPPPGFRLPPPTKWDQKDKAAMDHAGDYFLLTDLLRGMWVVLEQFFRPPFVAQCSLPGCADVATATPSCTRLRRARFHHASGASTPSGDTRPARSAASPASCARPFARPRPSQSRPRSVRTGAGGRRDTTST